MSHNAPVQKSAYRRTRPSQRINCLNTYGSYSREEIAQILVHARFKPNVQTQWGGGADTPRNFIRRFNGQNCYRSFSGGRTVSLNTIQRISWKNKEKAINTKWTLSMSPLLQHILTANFQPSYIAGHILTVIFVPLINNEIQIDYAAIVTWSWWGSPGVNPGKFGVKCRNAIFCTLGSLDQWLRLI